MENFAIDYVQGVIYRPWIAALGNPSKRRITHLCLQEITTAYSIIVIS
jgi:hypothetical protein